MKIVIKKGGRGAFLLTKIPIGTHIQVVGPPTSNRERLVSTKSQSQRRVFPGFDDVEGGGVQLEMAAQGSGVVFQEKVSRLLSRADGKPVLKPNKRLALGDSVANRRPKKGGKNAASS